MRSLSKRIQDLDKILIGVIVLISIVSLVSVASASRNDIIGHPDFFVMRQAIWFVIGFVGMVWAIRRDYVVLGQKWKTLYGFGIFALLLVFAWGTVTNGANSWLELGPIKIEPGEFMKLIMIISFSSVLAGCEEGPTRKDVGKVIMMALIPIGLVVLQPDLGTALMMVSMTAGLLWVAGIRASHTGSLFGLGIAGMAILSLLYMFHDDWFFKIIQPYQWHRLTSFLNPISIKDGDGYQLYQSLVAIADGRWIGEGIFHGIQTQSAIIPERHTDFIFAVITEEMGFFGAFLLILLYWILLNRMAKIGREARDPFGAYMVAGVISMFIAQIFENIGMTMSMMPITGITLPLVSYGGSSILTTMLAMGLVLNVGYRRHKIKF